MSDQQHRKLLLTIQNPHDKGFTHDVIDDIMATMNVTYYCYADEIAPTTGTMHTHVFIYRKTAIRDRTIRAKFPDVHYDHCIGTCRECRDYVAKTGKWAGDKKADTTVEGSFREFGEMPTERQEKTPELSDVIDAVENGKTTAEIIKENPKYVFRTKDIDALRETLVADKQMNASRDVTVSYLFGPTGSGKTSSIFDRYTFSDVFRITSYGANGIRFDGYHGQPVLVFEEFAGQVPIADMLNYLDRYPLSLPARYSDKVACFDTVFITSNLPLEQQYVGVSKYNPAVWMAWLRRISRIVEFLPDGTQIQHDKKEYEV